MDEDQLKNPAVFSSGTVNGEVRQAELCHAYLQVLARLAAFNGDGFPDSVSFVKRQGFPEEGEENGKPVILEIPLDQLVALPGEEVSVHLQAEEGNGALPLETGKQGDGLAHWSVLARFVEGDLPAEDPMH